MTNNNEDKNITIGLKGKKEDKEKFLEFAKGFNNQGEAFSALLDYSSIFVDNALTKENQSSINNFNHHANQLLELFISTIKAVNSTEERVKCDYEKELKSSTDKNNQLQNTILKLNDTLKQKDDEMSALKVQIESLNAELEKNIEEKTAVNHNFEVIHDELKIIRDFIHKD